MKLCPHGLAAMRWDIRVEPAGIPVVMGGVAVPDEPAIRVRYRPLGKRGRFESFVLVGELPKGRSIFDVVREYEAGRVAAIAAKRKP